MAFVRYFDMEKDVKMKDEQAKIKDQDGVYLAIMLHDVIYDPVMAMQYSKKVLEKNVKDGKEAKRGKGYDEKMSVLKWKEYVKMAGGALQKFDPKVTNLILATIEHKIPNHVSEHERVEYAAFLDGDMSVVGLDFERYKVYSEQIWFEFVKSGAVTDLDYCKGRPAVLAKLVNGGVYLQDDELRGMWEKSAERNVSWETEQLTKRAEGMKA
ncbi:hypothetical protein T439DRAFT_330082 [Meredithblackwellia eburnea MCA 4105]